jgi:hypothetical protein
MHMRSSEPMPTEKHAPSSARRQGARAHRSHPNTLLTRGPGDCYVLLTYHQPLPGPPCACGGCLRGPWLLSPTNPLQPCLSFFPLSFCDCEHSFRVQRVNKTKTRRKSRDGLVEGRGGDVPLEQGRTELLLTSQRPCARAHLISPRRQSECSARMRESRLVRRECSLKTRKRI